DGISAGTITVTDTAEGQFDSKIFRVAVFDPAVIGTSVPVSAVEGAAFTGKTVATFTDPGGAEPNSFDSGSISFHYSATIDWGDNTPTTAGTITFSGTPGSKTDLFTVAGDHAYTTNGTYPIKVTINHEGIITKTTSTAVVKAIVNHTQGCCDSNALVI